MILFLHWVLRLCISVEIRYYLADILHSYTYTRTHTHTHIYTHIQTHSASTDRQTRTQVVSLKSSIYAVSHN